MRNGTLTIDNRDLPEVIAVLEARIEALTEHVRKLEEYIREQEEMAREFTLRAHG